MYAYEEKKVTNKGIKGTFRKEHADVKWLVFHTLFGV